jgi:hypothetical protein
MRKKGRPVLVYMASFNDIRVFKTIKSAQVVAGELTYAQLAQRLRRYRRVMLDEGILQYVDVE